MYICMYGRYVRIRTYVCTGWKLHRLEIAYSNQCHYDGVEPMRTDVPPIPPALTGTTSFVKTIL